MYQGLPQFPITFCDINTLWKSKFRLSTQCEFEKRGFCGNLWISHLILSYLQGFVQKPVHITQGFREFSTYSQGGCDCFVQPCGECGKNVDIGEN